MYILFYNYLLSNLMQKKKDLKELNSKNINSSHFNKNMYKKNEGKKLSNPLKINEIENKRNLTDKIKENNREKNKTVLQSDLKQDNKIKSDEIIFELNEIRKSIMNKNFQNSPYYNTYSDFIYSCLNNAKKIKVNEKQNSDIANFLSFFKFFINVIQKVKERSKKYDQLLEKNYKALYNELKKLLYLNVSSL